MANRSKLEQPNDIWIREFPELWDLAWCLYCLALDYRFRWADFWPDKWHDWPWVKRAIEQTFVRIDPEEKSILQEPYERFVENAERYDEIAMSTSRI